MLNVRLIGVPLDLGSGRRGVDMGPSALRIAGLADKLSALGYVVRDEGDITIRSPEAQTVLDPRLRYLPEISRAVGIVCTEVEQALTDDDFPLVLGGDHAVAIGTIAGVSSFFRKKNQRVGTIWIDAHGDMNTPETSPSGNIHGMPLAVALGIGAPELLEIGGSRKKIEPANTVLVGIRELDQGEIRNIQDKGVKVFSIRDIDQRGICTVMEEAIAIASNGTAGFHVSFDADALDPHIAPGVGTPVKGGLNYREAHLIMEMIHDSGKAVAIEFVEVNPILDNGNRTAVMGTELIASCLGKKII